MGNKPAIVLKPSWWGLVMTISIIFVRAFRPGAMPMEDWSIASWLIMLAPALFPLYMYLACWAVYGGGMSLVWLFYAVTSIAGVAWRLITGNKVRGRS